MITTLDVARAAVRAGVLDVTVIALESPEEIPADPEEIAEAEAEGITILYRKGPHRFVGDGGRVTGLETIDVESVFDDEHRFNPTFKPGTEAVLAADTVILAVGQTADLEVLVGTDLEQNRGGIKTDPATLRTSHPRIWAGGDVAHGPRNLIDAIADGQRAAASIHSGATAPADHSVRIELTRRVGFRRLSTGYDAIARQPIPATPSDRRIGFTEVEVGYGAHDAWLESLRCLAVLRQRHARSEPVHPVRAVCRCLPTELHHHRSRRPCRPRHRGAERAAARRRHVHSLRALRQPVPSWGVVDGAREGVDQ